MKAGLIISVMLSLVLMSAGSSFAGADVETAVTSRAPALAAPFSAVTVCDGDGTCPPSAEIREAHEPVVADIRSQPCGRDPC